MAAAIRKSPSLMELNLESNDITDEGARELLAAMHDSPCLRKLSLRFNCIQDYSLLSVHERTPPLVQESVPHAEDEVPTSARAFQQRHERNRTRMAPLAGVAAQGPGYASRDVSRPMASPREVVPAGQRPMSRTPSASPREAVPAGHRPMSRTPSLPSEAGSSVSWVSSRVSSQMSRQLSGQPGYSGRTPGGEGRVGGLYALPQEARQRPSGRHRHASQDCPREPSMCDQFSDRSRSTGASTSRSGFSAGTSSSRLSSRLSAQTGSAYFASSRTLAHHQGYNRSNINDADMISI